MPARCLGLCRINTAREATMPVPLLIAASVLILLLAALGPAFTQSRRPGGTSQPPGTTTDGDYFITE